MRTLHAVCAAVCLLAVATGASAQMTVEEYTPRNTLKVPGKVITRAKFPFIDVHGHQRTLSETQVDALVRDMDELNMAVMVDLSGGSGAALARKVAAYRAKHGSRFVVFANADFSGLDDPAWGQRAAAQLEADYRAGARGLKIFKNLGMTVSDSRGRVRTDDPRLDPLWAKAGELGIPVLIHTAEPAEFFQPIDRFNERWLELKLNPGRARAAEPSWETLMNEQWNVFRKHPRTKFISAHLSWLGNDLARLGKMLDELPNMYTELGAVVYDIGRQPRFAKQFLTKYQDRVLIGKDTYNKEEYYTYFRVLESEDEYFNYYRRYHAFWQMYGVGLDDDVLRKIYGTNAARIIPGIDALLLR